LAVNSMLWFALRLRTKAWSSWRFPRNRTGGTGGAWRVAGQAPAFALPPA